MGSQRDEHVRRELERLSLMRRSFFSTRTGRGLVVGGVVGVILGASYLVHAPVVRKM